MVDESFASGACYNAPHLSGSLSSETNRTSEPGTAEQVFRHWRICRYIIRLTAFTLFDTAICTLIIGTNGDGDAWQSCGLMSRMLELGAVTIAGGLILLAVSWHVDRPVRQYAALRTVEAIPLLSSAALTDAWDAPDGGITRDAAKLALKQIIAERVDAGAHEELCKYTPHLLRLMADSDDVALLAQLVQWVVKARPLCERRALRMLERRDWLPINPTTYMCVRTGIVALNDPANTLLRGCQRPSDKTLLRPATAGHQMKPDELLRASEQ